MIPVCEPYLAGNELKYAINCIKTNWISSSGKYIKEFEERFAEYCGCTHGITTTSGTTALHLALASVGIGKGDEVIVPTFTMAASAFAVSYTGATPVFVDCEPLTFNIDVAKIKDKITEHTKAIMPVHIYGHVADMRPIMEIAKEYNLYVIEDAAEAHGAMYDDLMTGSIGHIGCFSFYSNKILTTGEGGMIVTNDNEIAIKARKLKDLAHSSTRFLHTDIGFNYRMTNIQAAIGLAQLEKIDEYINRRRYNAELYNDLLKGLNIQLPMEMPWVKNVYWMYAILLQGKRNAFMEYLKNKGIDTRTFFIPMHKQPMYKEDGDYPVADSISARGLYLPSSTGLKEKDIIFICEVIRGYMNES
jgi:perosamine synthetase